MSHESTIAKLTQMTQNGQISVDPFFELDKPYETVFSEEHLIDISRCRENISNVLYQPESLTNKARKAFQAKKFHNVSFSKTTIRDIEFKECDFQNCLFIDTKFLNCKFHHSTSIKDCNFYRSEFHDCYIDPSILVFSRAISRKYSNIVVHTFQDLLRNSKQMAQPLYSQRADIAFKKALRDQWAYNRRKGRLSHQRYFWRVFHDRLFSWSMNYGYSPVRFGAWLIVLMFGLAFLNMHVIPVERLQGMLEGAGYREYLYFTIVTLTTLGFGDIHPKPGWGMLVIASESFLGLIGLSCLAAVIIKSIFKD